MEEKTKTSGGFATAGLVLGIVAMCLSFIPILNNASFFLGIIGVILAIVALVKNGKSGKAVAGLVLCILSVVITLSLQSLWSSAIDDVSKNLDNMTGENTEDILGNDVDVQLGNFEVVTDEYGINDTKMLVKVTNKTDKKQSFSIKVEAIDNDGSRIDDDFVYADSLGAGQSQEFEIFNFVSTEKIDKLRNATFKILEVSKY